MNFKDTAYIIMGGTSGMGLFSAMALKKQGARVVAVGKDNTNAEHAKEVLGQNCTVLVGDGLHESTIKNAIKTATKRYGQVNGLFHVAGGSGRKFGDGPLDEMTLEGWNKTLELNLTTLMLSNREVIRYFLDKKISGTILNMSSVLSYSPSPKYFVTHAYAAAKSAIIGFTKSIAAYYASSNISANVIAPGLMETPMSQRAIHDEHIRKYLFTKQPLDGGRPGISADIESAVLMFLAPSTKFITGQVLAVDGGWTVSEGQYI